MARGIYSDMPGINAKDYVVSYRSDRKTWSVDRVGAGGTHTTIGSTRGFGTTEAVRKAIEADAHVKGVRNAEIHNEGGAAGVLKNGRVYFFPGAFANDGYTHKVREASRKGPTRHREPADEQAAHELVLYIDNTSDLSLQGPRGQGRDIAVNLMRKRAKGVYDPALAVKLLEYLTEAGAKRYAKEMGSSEREWSAMFTPATRHEAAKELEETFRQAADAGDYSHLELRRGVRENSRRARESGDRGYHVMTWGGGRYTSIGWFATRQEAEREVARIKMSGRWSSMPPKIEAAEGRQYTREGSGSRGLRERPRMDRFTRAYFETALWSSTDNSDDSGGEPLDENYDISDIADETRAKMIADCEDFQERFADLLADAPIDSERAGHNFWLSRNGHGAGFFDDNLDELQDAAESYGSFDLYVGDDGQIYES